MARGAWRGMIVGGIVVLIGLGAIALGGLQLGGRLPTLRRTPAVAAYTNMAVGILLVALGILRLKGLL